MTERIGHIRCITCGKVLGRYHKKYDELISQGVQPGEVMNRLGLTRPCCRLWMLSPFSVPIRNQSSDVIGLEEEMENLTISTGSQTITGSLQAMQNSEQYNTPTVTIQPEETNDFGLMPIPQVALPKISDSKDKTKPKSTVRVYQAW